MTTTYIQATNVTNEKILINDMGKYIDATSSINLCEFFMTYEISNSKNLKTYVGNGTIVINDGVNDLSAEEGLRHIRYETDWEDEHIIDAHNISDHLDISTDSVSDGYTIKFNESTGLWTASEPTSDIYYNGGDMPPDDATDGQQFTDSTGLITWSRIEGEWISIATTFLSYSKAGNADGEYLSVGGWTSSNFYFFPRSAYIISLYARSLSGNNNKSFTMIDGRDDSTIYTFGYDNKLYYIDTETKISIDKFTELKIFVDKSGAKITNNMVQLEIAWRYQS